MKTTVELPDATFRRAKAVAAGRGMTLRRSFTEAVEERLCFFANESRTGGMAGLGERFDLADENRRVLQAIAAEFETLSPQDLA